MAPFGCDVMRGTVAEFRQSEEDRAFRDSEVQGAGINSEPPEFSHCPVEAIARGGQVD